MKRWVYAYDIVVLGPLEVARRLEPNLRTQLQAATGSGFEPPAGDGTFLITVPARLLGHGVTKRVRVSVEPSHRSGGRLVIPLRWRAEPAGALFPTFDGTLEVEGLDARRSQLTLVGCATAPLGPLGGVVDAALLHRVAQSTAERLVADLGQQLALHEADDAIETAPDVAPRIHLTVGDVMTSDPITVDGDLPLRTAALLLHHLDIAGVPVVEADGVPVGVLSEVDLLPHLATDRFSFGPSSSRERRQRAARTAGEACSRPARCTAVDASLTDAVRVMLEQDVSRLVVMRGSRVAGIVTRHDVLRALVRTDTEIAAAVQATLRAEGAGHLDVRVEWGQVTLSGEVELRSQAIELPTRLESIEGVDEVLAADVRWRVDDELVLPAVPFT